MHQAQSLGFYLKRNKKQSHQYFGKPFHNPNRILKPFIQQTGNVQNPGGSKSQRICKPWVRHVWCDCWKNCSVTDRPSTCMAFRCFQLGNRRILNRKRVYKTLSVSTYTFIWCCCPHENDWKRLNMLHSIEFLVTNWNFVTYNRFWKVSVFYCFWSFSRGRDSKPRKTDLFVIRDIWNYV